MAMTMTVNLGKARGASRHDKAGKAIRELKRRVKRRVDTEDVRISNTLNEHIWDRGASKPPKTVVVELIDREDHILIETADVDRTTPSATDVDDAVEEQDDETEGAAQEEQSEAAEQEADEETYDIPADVRTVLREGTIPEAKETVKELNKADFERLLSFEEEHQNRKGMKKFLRSNMR